jgi:hypothetical protein
MDSDHVTTSPPPLAASSLLFSSLRRSHRVALS